MPSRVHQPKIIIKCVISHLLGLANELFDIVLSLGQLLQLEIPEIFHELK